MDEALVDNLQTWTNFLNNPGRITDIIKSTLPKNRDLNIRDSQEFIKIAQRVREGLKSGHEDYVL